MNLLNDQLNNAIAGAFEDRVEMDTEDLQENMDYDTMENPSLLRFLTISAGRKRRARSYATI